MEYNIHIAHIMKSIIRHYYTQVIAELYKHKVGLQHNT